MTHYPTPPKQGMSTGAKVALGCGIPAVLALIAVSGCAAFAGKVVDEADKSIKAEQAKAIDDVKMVTCEVTETVIGRDLESKVKITNHGSKRANYIVEGEFLDAKGNKVGELMATVNNLAPKTSSTQDFVGVFGPDDLKGAEKGTCKIITVTRDEWLAAN